MVWPGASSRVALPAGKLPGHVPIRLVRLEAIGNTGGELTFQFESAPSRYWAIANRRVVRNTTEFPHAGVALVLPAARPFADRFGSGDKGPGNGFDAVLLGEADHLQAEEVRGLTVAHEIVICDGAHGERLAPVVVLANRSVPDSGVPESAVPPTRSSPNTRSRTSTIYISCPSLLLEVA